LHRTYLSGTLLAIRSSFVTLKISNVLRGCIGTLEAVRPLVEDVSENAFAAAFRDPRFSPVTEAELHTLQIDISVLSSPQPMRFDSEADLIAQLRPGFDGLILEEGRRRGTFLPTVWESLPEPKEFLRQLKLKAGLHPNHWSQEMKAYRYYTEVINDDR
jgi:AmmeMemoRadiSam system protein A